MPRYGADSPNSSPLEGLDAFRAQQAEIELRQVERREWWLWFSAIWVATLACGAFLLTAFPSFFRHTQRFYEIHSDQARWAILCLLLLFNGWMVYRQWSFRRQRRGLSLQTPVPVLSQISDPSGIDPVTGLYTRSFIEHQLGKEIARARRLNSALSVATIHLEEFGQVSKHYGPSARDEMLKELARRLKKSCRGCDFPVRLGSDDFLLVLPECNLGEVKRVLDRLGTLEVLFPGRKIKLEYTTGWVDYQPGDLPQDLLKRAALLLHLYENAS
jgi:diguanylate cyclase (GGDEF)-like protein